MNTEYQNNFNELVKYLNLKVSDSILDGKNRKNMNANEELFTLKIQELLNAGYASFIKTIQLNVGDYIKKTNLSRGFLLNTINGEMLDYPIEELITILKEAKKIPIEQRRNCLSLSDNPMKTQQILFFLKKLFKNFNNSANTRTINDKKENKENKKIIPVTPSFKKTVNIIKQNSSKNVVAKGKNLAAIYHSPSPVILHKNKKKIATNEKNRSHSKETYKTPDKKNWVY